MDQRAPVKPVSKALYMGMYIGPSILGVILVLIGIAAMAGGSAAADSSSMSEEAGAFIALGGFLMFILSGACFLISTVIIMVLYYKMWNAIQDGYARTTPGKAVGFLFIPVFNLYWMFQAIWGYSKDYNQFIRRNGIAAKPLAEGLFLTACILPLLGVIPIINWLTPIANMVVVIIMVNAICNSINALAAAEPMQASVTPPPLPGQGF